MLEELPDAELCTKYNFKFKNQVKIENESHEWFIKKF